MSEVINVYARAFAEMAKRMEFGLGGGAQAHVGKAIDKPLPKKVVYLAVAQAIYEMLWTSGRDGFCEEHQTASLMGHLTTNLGWYSLAALISADTPHKGLIPDIRWATQSKTNETITGVDFGIARIFSGGNAAPFVRILLFQAKRAKRLDGKWVADTEYIAGKGSAAAKEMLKDVEDEKATVLRASQLAGLVQASVKNYLDDNGDGHRLVEGILKRKMSPAHYQVEALLRTNFVGSLKAKIKRPWCFYSVWFKGDERGFVEQPKVITVEDVASAFWNSDAGKCNRPFMVPLAETDQNLIDVLGQCLALDEPEFGIDVRLSDVEQLVGKLCELLPQLNFMLASDSEGGGNMLADQFKCFNVTASLTKASQTAAKSAAANMSQTAERTSSGPKMR